jgi:hypothetical protein
VLPKSVRCYQGDRRPQAIYSWCKVGGVGRGEEGWGEWTMKLERVNSNGTD